MTGPSKDSPIELGESVVYLCAALYRVLTGKGDDGTVLRVGSHRGTTQTTASVGMREGSGGPEASAAAMERPGGVGKEDAFSCPSLSTGKVGLAKRGRSFTRRSGAPPIACRHG